MSQYHKLAEGAVNLVINTIQANISAALDVVAAGVSGTLPQVAIENPAKYFIFEKPEVFTCPAIFVILDDIDFRIADRKSNFINAQDKIYVSACVEDQDADRTTVKAWRYLSALHYVLDGTTMTSTDNLLVLKSVVYRTRLSAVYSRPEANGPGGQFRKEMMLECDVAHLENF